MHFEIFFCLASRNAMLWNDLIRIRILLSGRTGYWNWILPFKPNQLNNWQNVSIHNWTAPRLFKSISKIFYESMCKIKDDYLEKNCKKFTEFLVRKIKSRSGSDRIRIHNTIWLTDPNQWETSQIPIDQVSIQIWMKVSLVQVLINI